jgi:hypothetical protein
MLSIMNQALCVMGCPDIGAISLTGGTTTLLRGRPGQVEMKMRQHCYEKSFKMRILPWTTLFNCKPRMQWAFLSQISNG